MRYFVISLMVCCAIGLSESLSKERQERFVKMATACAKQEGASKSDLDEVIFRKPTTGIGANCIKACIMETMGVMTDNKADVEGFVNLVGNIFNGDAAKVASARRIASKCAEVTDTDRCEAASKIIPCGRSAADDDGVFSIDDL